MTTGWQQRLEQGLAELSMDAARLQAPLAAYIELLDKWNRAFNLTAVRDPAEMVTRHILDSLVILPHLGDAAVLDVGSGPGVPGMVLAIARPQQAFHLLDSNGKKTRFLKQAAAELALPNVSVHRMRAEDYRPENRFATVTARAFSSLQHMVDATRHLISRDGLLLAMKGELPQDEIDLLDDTVTVKEIVALQVPGLDAQRHLIKLQCPAADQEA